MKKIAVLITSSFLFISTVFAGGILTNSNQSAQYARMLSRNASTDLDAVYFNPAGLTQLKDGFYFALHNQTISQNRTITSEFPLLNNPEYKGKVNVPVFPTAFAVYKVDNWAFSAGFGPNGGGGSAKFDRGLPSFEKPISMLPALLTQNGIPTTDYSVKMMFEASSVFYGTQLNASYAISDHVSVSAGVRMINAVNKYNGDIADIMVNPTYPVFGASYTGDMVGATNFFADGSTFLKGLSTSSVTVSSGLSSAISAGTPSTTPLSAMPQATQVAVAQLLGAANISSSGMDIGTAAATLSTVAVGFSAKAGNMEEQSAATADKHVDTKQTGLGLTPMIGVDIHFDKINIGLKYEHLTVLKLTNSTTSDIQMADGSYLFPDKEESRSDIPAIVAAGVDYKITPALKVSGSYTMYVDEWIGWGPNIYGQKRTIDKNYLELAFGAEYWLNKNFALSAGYLNSDAGVSQQYQSDFSYSNDSYTTGLGFQWNIGKKMIINAGMMLTTYKDYTKTFDASFDSNAAAIGSSYNETYGKDTFTVAVGLGYKIF